MRAAFHELPAASDDTPIKKSMDFTHKAPKGEK